MTSLELFLEVDEDGHVVLEQLGRETERIGRKNRAVGPDLQRELLVVGNLAETRRFDKVVDLADGRVDRVHRDEADAEVPVKVLVGGDVATAALEAHLHVNASSLGDGADVDVGIEDLDVGVGLDLAGGDDAGSIRAQVKSLGALAVQLERNLLQVQDDVGCVLDHAGDGLELVQHAFDANRGDRCAFDGREQGAAQRVADGGAETALKRLRGKFAVVVGERLLINCETLGLLKTSPKHGVPFFIAPAKHSAGLMVVRLVVRSS